MNTVNKDNLVICGFGELPDWVQENVMGRTDDILGTVERINVEKVPREYQPDLCDTIRIIWWTKDDEDGSWSIASIAEYTIGLPTFEKFWATRLQEAGVPLNQYNERDMDDRIALNAILNPQP